MEKESKEKLKRMIQELQVLEQNYQQLLIQKNAFSMELNETEHTIEEVKKSKGKVSRIVGGSVVLQSTKEEVLSELDKRKSLISKRLEAIKKQEDELSKHIDEARSKIMEKME
ncbi:hypothetical protein D6829_00450 [Candidatus Pacearchaeota archaeon]|nr:MAG: hypothetical protein D6829_00450 [Candidatus Pacearchaeota archaeon]